MGAGDPALSAITLGEFAAGFQTPDDPRFRQLLETFRILEVTSHIALAYGRIDRALRRAGTPLGINDLWIAATALAHDLPLVTRNTGHFTRIPGLQIVDY
jgi:predicted nucleic acid-binding protein